MPSAMEFVTQDPLGVAITLLMVGAIALLSGVLAMARLWIGRNEGSVALRASAHWLPIALTAGAAVAMGRPELGVFLVLSTSVAILSVVVGFLAFAEPIEVPSSHTSRPLWLFLPMAATLAFVTGFRGWLEWKDAVALAGQGLLLLWVAFAPHGHETTEPVLRPAREAWSGARIAAFAVALAFVAVSAWVAAMGTIRLGTQRTEFPMGFSTAVILTAVLAMPMISTGTGPISRGHGWSVISAQLVVVLLNLCLLLPLVIVLPAVFGAGQFTWEWLAHAAKWSEALPVWRTAAAVHYPLVAWRIDAVALVILSILFVPIALGRVKLDRLVAAVLVAAYCLYLLSVLKYGRSPV